MFKGKGYFEAEQVHSYVRKGMLVSTIILEQIEANGAYIIIWFVPEFAIENKDKWIQIGKIVQDGNTPYVLPMVKEGK